MWVDSWGQCLPGRNKCWTGNEDILLMEASADYIINIGANHSKIAAQNQQRFSASVYYLNKSTLQDKYDD